jgi:hypothetical protein
LIGRVILPSARGTFTSLKTVFIPSFAQLKMDKRALIVDLVTLSAARSLVKRPLRGADDDADDDDDDDDDDDKPL